ncbi:hypothetical protein WH47_02648, partial [Habropoda laboriosa]
QKTIVVAFLVALFGYSAALPVKLEDNPSPVVGIPILFQESTGLENKGQYGSSPIIYGLLLSKLDRLEEDVNSGLIEKREVKENDQEDLETAAGTYALRPLFVYRQQLAYKQRVREAYRRRSPF